MAGGLDPSLASIKNLSLEKRWWNADSPKTFRDGKFVGQGRTMHYSRLVHAVMTATRGEEGDRFRNDIGAYDDCGANAADHFAGPKPFPWYATATAALLLVWSEIMMAVMFAFMTPTVGPGYWSGSCFLYGALSSIAWFVQFPKKQPGWLKATAYVFNGVAFIWLVAAIVMQVRGLGVEYNNTTSSGLRLTSVQ